VRTFLVVMAAAVALPACGARDGAESELDSGIRGRVMLVSPCGGPANPECDSSAPFPGARLTISEITTGRTVTLEAGSDGRFVVRLPAGEYVVEPVSPVPDGFSFAKPEYVTVEPHRFSAAHPYYHTGVY
jgi:hypothetical protein